MPGKGFTPALHGPQVGRFKMCTVLLYPPPILAALVKGHHHSLDYPHQILAVRKQKIRQNGQGAVAVLAKPPLDPDPIHTLFIFGFSLIAAMPCETILSPTPRAFYGAGTLFVLVLVNIHLLVTSKIG